MKTVLEFKNKEEFRTWLKENHDTSKGMDIFIYKKGFTDEGLSYVDAVMTALCYGWIDAVTHSYDEQKFIQYFAPRRKNSNWSLSNIQRMKTLIASNEMTEYGLKYFDMTLLDSLDQMIENNNSTTFNSLDIPGLFKEILVNQKAMELFLNETTSVRNRYIYYIQDAKKMETKIRRCHKVIGILKGEKNNL